MAIFEFSAVPLRRQIGFVREMPDQTVVELLAKRGYTCYLLDDETVSQPGLMGATDSVVFTQNSELPFKVRQDLSRFAAIALNYDCRAYVRHLVDHNALDFVLRTLNEFKLPPSGFNSAHSELFDNDWFEGPNNPPLAPCVHLLAANDKWDALGNLIARNPAGRSPNAALEIDIRNASHKPIDLREKEQDELLLLLRRAFWNCSTIRLVSKANGLSGVDTFEAFAQIAPTNVGGNWPQRYFVKMGPRLKIAREFVKYGLIALEHVPYHLGPRLRLDRCVLGQSQGLIVSDYVSGGEALRDCARDGRGVTAIGNLFNQTLIAWRRGAIEDHRPLQSYLLGEEVLKDRQLPHHRMPLIQAFGATKSVEELKSIIERSSPSQPVLSGVIHGDLHATNVLVRVNDAVIIDLERVQNNAPLLFDAASLEGGLFVDGFVKDQRSASEVLDSIRSLYTATAFDHAIDHYCLPHNPSTWFIESVRQIRMQVRQIERQRHQYAWTLAAVLLKKACNDMNFQERQDLRSPGTPPLTRESVRALAYVLAEQILLELSQEGRTLSS